MSPGRTNSVKFPAVAASYKLPLTGAMVMAENRIDLIRPDAPELAAFGPLPVDVTTLGIIHAGQIKIVAANSTQHPHGDRTLIAELWYPA